MKAKDIIDIMEKWAPKDLVDKWDNTGFQVGDRNRKVGKILLALDLDRMVLDRAIYGDYHMIITHHPLIFKSLKSITSDNHREKMILDIIKNDILVYNAHSNLDMAENGVNDQLARLLGLRDRSILRGIVGQSTAEEGKDREIHGYGRVGTIDETPMEDFIDLVKGVLGIERLIVYGDLQNKIRRVAVCGGSGSDFIYDAYKKQADLYLTGDIKYHEAQMAYELGLNIIDPGHFHSEKIILPVIKDYLEKELEGKVEINLLMESGLPRIII